MPRRTRRLTQLVLGLLVYAFSMALMMRAGLGAMPWDVLHQGLALRTGLSVGGATLAASIAVMLAWLPLRERPGIGTVANVVVIAATIDLALALVAAPTGLVARIAMAVAGIVLNAAATAAYVGVGLGPGPRDGLMTGLAARTGRSVRLVRTAIEVAVVLTGWLLGGTLGVVTVAYALAVGPLVGLLLPLLTVRTDPWVSPGRRSARRRPRHPR